MPNLDPEYLRRLMSGQIATDALTIKRDARTGAITELHSLPEEKDALMEALRLLNPSQPTAQPAKPALKSVPIGQAVKSWLASIESSTKPKTLGIKKAAVEGFAEHFGKTRTVAEIIKPAVAEWLDSLRRNAISDATLVNKVSYLRGFLSWCRDRGWIAFTDDDSPTKGLVKFGKREKRRRRGLGFRAFTSEQLAILYNPENLEHLRTVARWGALIGLYTGARVSEVGQLKLADFVVSDGIPCFRFTDEGEGQSLKTDASRRTIPIHPDLIKLGLMEKVKALRAVGKVKLFPRVSNDPINGQGAWLSKAFGRYLKTQGVSVDKGKLGFHSLRSTMVHALQDAGIVDEVRASITGHELDDEHHQSYSRAVKVSEMLEALNKVSFGLKLATIRKGLFEG